MNYKLASDTWDCEELLAIQRVVESGRFTMGREVTSFEEEFAKFFGSNYAVMTNSGSSANLLAIATLFFHSKYNLKKGDEVIVPAVSWATTYAPLQQYGLKIKFVDINVDTLNIDIEQLKEAISPNTKLLFAVNLLGNPNELKEIQELCIKNDVILLEDNCESMGATYEGKYTGTFGLMGTFSTFYSHHISTMEGGMILTDDFEAYEILKSLRAHGWTRDMGENNPIYQKSNSQFYEMFNFVLPGYNVRPLEIEAAVGREQLKKFSNFNNIRKNNGKYFRNLFGKLDFIYIQKEIEESSCFGFSLILKENSIITRQELINLFEKNKIDCRPIVAGNFTKNPVIQYYDYEIVGDLKNANFLHEQGLFIGNHHYDCSSELKKIYELIKNYIKTKDCI